MNKQVTILTKWQGKAMLKALGIALAVVFGLDIFFSLIALIGGATTMNWTNALTSFFGTISGITGFFGFLWALCFPYYLFKNGMAMGATRKSIWGANSLMLAGVAVFTWLMDLIKDFILYSSKGLSNFADGAWVSLATAFVGLSTVAAIGAGFALLSRRGKWLVGIGGPAALLFLAIVMLRWLAEVQPSTPMAFENWLVANGTAVLWASMLIWFALMMGLNYWFFMKMQLRRD